ncbi:hypothetical protein M231_02020 [Tremella mesenterica]|uniref:Uncharacterized protein n=1 Tax=Tremella mesenterica TaxID=5217 RepID=A0A4Q1BS14_TREME|nr:hypothetical protein M231_02020 [Tremella mesenterica]
MNAKRIEGSSGHWSLRTHIASLLTLLTNARDTSPNTLESCEKNLSCEKEGNGKTPQYLLTHKGDKDIVEVTQGAHSFNCNFCKWALEGPFSIQGPMKSQDGPPDWTGNYADIAGSLQADVHSLDESEEEDYGGSWKSWFASPSPKTFGHSEKDKISPDSKENSSATLDVPLNH